MRRMRYLQPACLLLLALGFLAGAYGFPPESRFVPVLIGWAMSAFCIADVASRSPGPVGRALTRWLDPAALRTAAEERPHPRSRQAIAVGGSAGFVAVLLLAGVLVAVPLFIAVAIRWGAGRGWLASLVAAAAVTLLIWTLFVQLLQLELFPGLLFGGQW